MARQLSQSKCIMEKIIPHSKTPTPTNRPIRRQSPLSRRTILVWEGMVCGINGNRRRIWHCFWRQFGGGGEQLAIWRRIIGNLAVDIWRIRSRFSLSPAAHSCESRNLTMSCVRITADSPTIGHILSPILPFPRSSFLRRQESLSHGRHRRLNYAAVGGTTL